MAITRLCNGDFDENIKLDVCCHIITDRYSGLGTKEGISPLTLMGLGNKASECSFRTVNSTLKGPFLSVIHVSVNHEKKIQSPKKLIAAHLIKY